MTNQITNTDELVYINNNHALTTSLIVAEKFGKEHKHVLEAIRSLLNTRVENSAFVDNQQLTKMFDLIEVEQPMPIGGGVKKIPMYVMNRDGFTLLAMGFTGEKALHFKLEYINAFNKMESKIKETMSVPKTFAQALMLAAKQQEEIEKQQKLLEEQKPKVKLAEAITTNERCYPLKDLASILASKGVKIGPNRLRHFLKDNHYLGERGACYNMPRHQYIEQGLFVVTEEPYTDQFGYTHVSRTVLVTGKGLEYFINKLYKEGNK